MSDDVLEQDGRSAVRKQACLNLCHFQDRGYRRPDAHQSARRLEAVEQEVS
jgi:hypothetical protein